ncbi:MAG: hypothetical protein ACLRR3_01600 [Eubacterium sp.]
MLTRIKYTPVYYNSETEIVQALKDNKIDLAAVGSISLHKGMRVVDRFNQGAFLHCDRKDEWKIYG